MKKFFSTLLLMLAMVSAAQAKFTYWSYADKDTNGAFGSATKGKAAIYIPAEVAQIYKGLKLTGVRVGLERSVDELAVFATTDLNSSSTLASKTADRGNVGTNVVKFDDPYIITGEAFYVGYEFSGSDPAISVSKYYNTNANWTDTGSGWVNNATTDPKNGKALLISMRIEGDELPLEAALVNVNDVAIRSGQPFHITGRVLNFSAEKIYDYRIGYTIGDGEEQFADFEQTIGERSEGDFDIEHEAITGSEKAALKVRLVSVNGSDDAYAANNTQESSLLFAYLNAQKRAVMEEFTGLYCGFCPRGIVGIEKCQERFGDRFIAIAKHNYSGTPSALMSPTYDYNISGGFPKSIIDRRYQCDPGPTTSPSYVSASINSGCSAGVAVEAGFVEGSDSTQISARALAQFTSTHTNANYRFAFAIVEDSVTGYTQANNYYGSSTNMGGWEKRKKYADVTLMHVARMGYGISNGIENSVPTKVDEFTPISYDVVLDVPSTVQSKKNLRVIVLLLNKSTGYIDNAAETDYVKEIVANGIADIQTKSPTPDIEVVGGKVVADGFNGNIHVYTVSGMAVKNEGLAHGVYIVKLDNGKQVVAKQIVY